MILIGYPGIGKSTLARTSDSRFIDLESSYFPRKYRGEEIDWQDQYCRIAIDLHDQGYLVFTSSHDVVRNKFHQFVQRGFIKHNEVALVFPAIVIYDKWIEMLERRYKTTKLDKDLRALDNARSNFQDQINELKEDSFGKILLYYTPGEYNLEEVIMSNIRETKNYVI